MYILIVVSLMFVFPTVSILADIFLFKSSTGTMALIGKWFVFWGAGIRVFLSRGEC